MPVALIVGAFGQDNPGDEALLDASVTAVRAQPGWVPLVVTARPAETTARLAVDAVRPGDLAAAQAAVRADALVVGGGTVFKELHPSTGRSRGALLRRAAALTGAFRGRGRPVALIGVGAAPIARSANRRLARSIARCSDLLVLRDAESAVILAGLGAAAPLRVGADLAWLCSVPPAPMPRVAAAPVGVAVSHLAGGDRLMDRLADALRPLARAGHPVEVEPWQGSPRLGADAVHARRLARRIGAGASVVPPPVDLDEAVARMAGRSVAVALRFHAAVAAAEAGTPFVSVTHEPKLAGIADRMGQHAVDPRASASVIAEAVQQAILGPPPSPEAVTAERRRAEATVDLLGLVLCGDGPASHLELLDLVPTPTPA